jgi:hypothetical protein
MIDHLVDDGVTGLRNDLPQTLTACDDFVEAVAHVARQTD